MSRKKEPTRVMRVPESMVEEIKVLIAARESTPAKTQSTRAVTKARPKPVYELPTKLPIPIRVQLKRQYGFSMDDAEDEGYRAVNNDGEWELVRI